jgi:putative membrane protein
MEAVSGGVSYDVAVIQWVIWSELFMGFFIRAGFAAAGLWLATQFFSGLAFDQPITLIAAALLLGIVNAVIRPLLLLLTLPLTVLTLGFFLLVINAAMIGLVAWMLKGFSIAGFWTAVGTSLIVSFTSWIGSSAIGDSGRIEVYASRGSGGRNIDQRDIE